MTHKSIAHNFKNAALLFVAFTAGLYLADHREPVQPPYPHNCTFEDCPMKGNTVFMSDNPVGSDEYLFDQAHWNHPTWSADQIEDYLFNIKPSNEITLLNL